MTDTSDLIGIDTLLTPDELALREKVRGFVDSEIKPNIADWYEQAVFPLEIVPEMAEAGPARHAPEGLRLRRPDRRGVRPGRRWNWRPATRAADVRLACRARWP